MEIPPPESATPALPPSAAKPVSRRRVFAATAAMLGLSAAATGAYAVGIEPKGLRVTRYAPRLPAWPARRKLSITVIADLHAGGPDMTLSHVQEVIDTANDLRSDLILLLGDYVATYEFSDTRMAHVVWSRELARLSAPLGVHAILGNHDWRVGIADIRRALVAVGIPVMENDAVLIGETGARFWLAGLGDQWAYRLGYRRYRGVDDLPGTLSRITTDDPVLLMAHEPDIFPRVPRRVALTLAGHTHGGQVRVPLIWPAFVPSEYGARYAYGHVVEDDRHLIVSGGLGTSFIPARLGVPPEILRIDLGA
jgi:hypothetical protein